MRGDLVSIAAQGDVGKPRPALVIQADLFDAHSSTTVLPLSSDCIDAPLLRINLQPSAQNGLQKPSQVMVDKALTLKRDKLGPAFGRVEPEVMLQVERSLAVFLGIAN